MSAVWVIGWFGYLNWVLMVANMIPALPFDAGRMVRAWPGGTSVALPRDSIVAPYLARSCALVIAIVGVVRLVGQHLDGTTLIGLAILIEYLVRTEARMLEDGDFFDDGLFGYDFSEGYTSLESGAAKVRPYRESALKRWRRRRSDSRRQRRVALEAAEERRMDEILEKLYREGRAALTDEENRFLVRVSAVSQPDEKHVNEPRDQGRGCVVPTQGPGHTDQGPSRSVPAAITAGPGESRSLLAAIAAGPVVLDAGMGTRLMALSLDPRSDDPALWNRARPADVLAMHRRDIAAGAAAILTNTFGANRFWLSKWGQNDAVELINRRAVLLARDAAGEGRFVIGDIGPTAALRPGAAVEQAAILVDAGVDALILETYGFPDVERVLRDIRSSLRVPIPLLASLWQWPDPYAAAARRLVDAGANVIGMNCQAGIEAAIAFAEGLHGQTGCPLLVKPSAGRPGRPADDSALFARRCPDSLTATCVCWEVVAEPPMPMWRRWRLPALRARPMDPTHA